MKQFVVSDDASAEKPPIEFQLAGRYIAGTTGPGGATTWSLDLAATPTPPLAALDQLRDAILTDPTTRRQVYNPSSVIGFLRAVMMPNSIVPFDNLVNDRTMSVEMAQLGEVLAWLSEQYVGGPNGTAPTGAPSSSTTGGADAGNGQTAGSPLQG